MAQPTAPTGINQRIAERVREMRSQQGLSLEMLAAKSGVSRSMISLIERGESSPTATVIEKLAISFGVPLAALFNAASETTASGPVSRREDQAEWEDPGSGYIRRNVSPAGITQMQLVDVRFPTGRRVTFENGPGGVRIQQQVWVLEGTMEISVGRDRHRLREGDCLVMQLDQPTTFFNPGRKPARYVVAVCPNTPARRS